MVTAEQLLASDWPYKFAIGSNRGEDYDGCCPCAYIKGENFEVEISCWRTNGGFSEIAVLGKLDRETKEKIGLHIQRNNGWTDHTDWHIEY